MSDFLAGLVRAIGVTGQYRDFVEYVGWLNDWRARDDYARQVGEFENGRFSMQGDVHGRWYCCKKPSIKVPKPLPPPIPTTALPPGSHPDIMISYCWANDGDVLRIYQDLVQRDLTVWLDKYEMSGNIYQAMASAIENCKVVVPIISPDYDRSFNAKELELTFAVQLRKQIVPIRLELGKRSSGLEFLITGKLYFLLAEDQKRDPNLWNDQMDNICTEIRRLIR